MPRLTNKKKAASAQEEFVMMAKRIAALAADKKAKDIAAFDVRGLTLLADAFVLCTATSEPQLKAVFHWVHDEMKNAGTAPLRTEGGFKDGWMVIDYGSVIFHLFRERARAFYDLDGMWGDAPALDLGLAEAPSAQ